MERITHFHFFKIYSLLSSLQYFLQITRHMRGEDLHELNIEELQQLEKTIEVGLSRVIEEKVFVQFIL